MKITHLALFLIGLLPFVVAHSSADVSRSTVDDSKLEFTSIQNLEELLSANITPTHIDRIDPRRATLSPDGEIIVFYYHDRERRMGMVCKYTFSANATTCMDGGNELTEFIGGFWSPDSRYVVLNNDVTLLRLMREYDLTIYDTETDTIINRTDDGVSARENILDNAVRNQIWIDNAPIFAPNGDLYFIRNAIDPSVDEWRADLMKIPASELTGTSAPEVLWRHPTIIAFPIFRTTDWYLDGAMSISPDGRYLAISSTSLGRPDDTSIGVWVFDLAENSVKIQIPVPRLGEVTVGVPAWLSENMLSRQFSGVMPNSLAWTTDSNTLVIWSINGIYFTEFFVPIFKYDVVTDTLASIYDFTTLSEDDYKPNIALFDDISIFADVNPTVAVMSPSYQTIFYIGRDAITRTFVLSAMSVVESEFATPRRIVTLPDYESLRNTMTSIGYTSPTLHILTGASLITLTEQ